MCFVEVFETKIDADRTSALCFTSLGICSSDFDYFWLVDLLYIRKMVANESCNNDGLADINTKAPYDYF